MNPGGARERLDCERAEREAVARLTEDLPGAAVVTRGEGKGFMFAELWGGTLTGADLY
ncbi:MAG: hypothetical protein ACR2G6_13250 [Gemmatimonadaceae bacterium]